MTVGQDMPLSRRQLRSLSREESESQQEDSKADDVPVNDADVDKTPQPTPPPAAGRRVKWDPASGRPPAVEETASSSPDAERPTPTSARPADAESADAEPPSYDSGRPERRRSSFAPAFTSSPADDGQSDATGPDSTELDATDPDATDPDASAPVDLAAPERTMTRRELRILRARAEAAGQPAPDVIFLPSGETTVTGAIPILDGEAFAANQPASEYRAPHDSSAEPADSSAEPAVDLSVDHPIDVVVIEKPGDDFPTTVETAAATVDPDDRTDESRTGGSTSDENSSGEPSSDEHRAVEHSSGEPRSVRPTEFPERDAPEIPALVEPAPDATSRFPGAVPAELPPEIVVDVEPVAAEPVATEQDRSVPVEPALVDPVPVDPVSVDPAPVEPSSVDTVDTESRSDATSNGAQPAPGSLRPFDALFLPPSTRTGTASDSRLDGEADDAIIDTSAAGLPDDATGVRGAILTESSKPFGHWSTQEEVDDAEPALSRDVSAGAGAVTTHALVLPSIPDASEPLLSPLTSTGEIMVTGTIDLPRSYGSTGAHPALFDHSDVDALIDDVDRDDGDTGVAPVRATRAVSSTTTTRSMIGAEPEKKSRLLPIVAISLGGAVFIAAVSWLVASMFFTQF